MKKQLLYKNKNLALSLPFSKNKSEDQGINLVWPYLLKYAAWDDYAGTHDGGSYI